MTRRRGARALLGLGWLWFGWIWVGCTSDAATDTADAASSSTETAQTTTESESGADTKAETSTDTETGAETETGTDTDEPEGNLLLSDRVLNIAHRGGRVYRPEATLLAFEHALASGADVLEFDLHASSDGVIVVIHDDTVDRTTDGTGDVSAMTFDELRLLDACYDFSPDGGQTHPYRGMGVQLPTPQEIFDAFPDRYYLMEIKQSEPSIVPTLLDVIDDYGLVERVVIASFAQVTIDEVRASNLPIMTAMTAPEMVEFVTMGSDPNYAPPCLFVQPPWEGVDQALVDNAALHGLKVHPWTVNTEGLMHTLIDLGVDGIMSDDPILLAQVLSG